MSFWESFRRGAEANIDCMGEPVIFGGEEGRGVVDDLEENPTLVPGGGSRGVKYRVQVSPERAAAIPDGMKVTVRGYEGRVTGRQSFGGGEWIEIGPANRWDGEI